MTLTFPSRSCGHRGISLAKNWERDLRIVTDKGPPDSWLGVERKVMIITPPPLLAVTVIVVALRFLAISDFPAPFPDFVRL